MTEIWAVVGRGDDLVVGVFLTYDEAAYLCDRLNKTIGGFEIRKGDTVLS